MPDGLYQHVRLRGMHGASAGGLTNGAACRMFWPREVWGRYGDSLEDFKAPENAEAAVGCLNELVTDALRWEPLLQHIP